MIDCTCNQTFLNTNEQKSHAIERVVLYGERPKDHQIDHDGPSVFHQ